MDYRLICFFLILSLYKFNQQCISATEIILDLEKNPIKSSYNGVIKLTRDLVRSNTFYEGIPMMKPPSQPVVYIVITLLAKRGTEDIRLSVAISKENLYTVGYADQSIRKAFFFSDHASKVDASVFPGPGVQLGKEILHFGSGYNELEGKAGLNREDMKLTLETLRFSMLDVHGAAAARQPDFYKNQAKFLLYITQAFSEAARFQYVQKKFSSRRTEKLPNHKVPTLENAWSPISSGIKNAEKRKLKPPIILANEDGETLEVKTVDEIKPDMGILLYVA